MWARKRNSIILSFLFGSAAIPIFLGIPTAQAAEKIIFKIEKDKKEVTEPSKKPSKEVSEAEGIEIGAKKEKKKETYSYDPTNKVDPFKSFIVVKKELEEKEKPKTYLETLDLSQLTISAIVLNSTTQWALVRDSKGDGHVIKVGTLLGRRGGRVTRILEKEVVVTEYYQDIRGREIVRDTSMKLPEVD
jgi:type IV pilus assembly protein PilP